MKLRKLKICPRLFLCCCLFAMANPVHAHNPTIVGHASSFNPVGSGARALGQGGAFIAVADDATAASWNPAGLYVLQIPEISATVNYLDRREDNRFGRNPEADGSMKISETDLNYASAAYPFHAFGRNMIFSLNYQHLYDFHREWRFPITRSQANWAPDENVHYVQDGLLSALGPAFCVAVNPDLSVGVVVNIWDNDITPNEWEEKYRVWGSQTYALPGRMPETVQIEYEKHDRYTFKGINANLGVMWRATDKLSLGCVLKTPFTADLRHETWESNRIGGVSVTDEKLDMPMSYGVGLSYRFSDDLRIAADVYVTEWDEYIITDSEGRETSPVTGKSAAESDIDPVCVFRTGVEYKFTNRVKRYSIPVRAGLFYDPAPADGGTDDFYGISAGAGIAFGRFAFDAACQYRFGGNVGSSLIRNYDFEQDVDEFNVCSSLIIYFFR